MVLLAITLSLLATRQASGRFVALPGTPVMYTESGRPVDRLKVAFHRLELLNDDEGVSHFRLDDGELIKANSAGLYGPKRLIPTVESPRLAQLRQAYLGRRVWFYGEHELFRESINPRRSDDVVMEPGLPVRVIRIFQLAKRPIQFSALNFGGDYPLSGSYGIRAYTGAGPVLFVFDGSFSESKVKPQEPGFTHGYNIFPEDWYLDHLMSLTPPSAQVLKSLHRWPQAIDLGDVSGRLAGLTHEEVAWAVGFPPVKERVSALLQEPRWKMYFWEFKFDGDRLTYAYNYMSH